MNGELKKMSSIRHVVNLDSPEIAVREDSSPAAMANEFRQGAARRVSDADLLEALLNYRAEPDSVVADMVLRMLVFSCIRYAVAGFVRRAPDLAAYRDDLVQMVWQRLLSQENRHGKLLTDYEPGDAVEQGRTCGVYAWLWRNVNFAVGDQFRELERAYLVHDGKRIPLETPLELEPDEEAMSEDARRPMSRELGVSETPLRDSCLRVQRLVPWLATMADEMVGQELALTKMGESYLVCFEQAHKEYWLAYLALSEAASTIRPANLSKPEFYDLAEIDLAKKLGTSKGTLQRRTDEAYAYILSHKLFSEKLDLMIPNRLRTADVNEDLLRAKMRAALWGPGGKVKFRELVHTWLSTHY